MSTPEYDSALFHVLVNALQEVWVLKDRQIVLEKVLEDSGINVAEAIERLQPDPALSTKLDAERQRFLKAVLEPLHPTDDV